MISEFVLLLEVLYNEDYKVILPNYSSFIAFQVIHSIGWSVSNKNDNIFFMKSNTTYWLFLTTLSGLLIACKESPVPSADRFRLAKVQTIYINGNLISNRRDTLTDLYTYNTNGQLASLFSPAGNSILSYNDQGQLIEKKTTFIYDSLTPSYVKYLLGTLSEYSYDKAGKLIKLNIYNVHPNDYNMLAQEYAFGYDSNVWPSTISLKLNNGGQFDPDIYLVTMLVYRGGNSIEQKTTSMPVHYNKYQSEVIISTLTYDTKKNSFYHLYGAHYEKITDLFFENNVFKADQTYSYDGNGLLIRATQANGTVITTYFYESY